MNQRGLGQYPAPAPAPTGQPISQAWLQAQAQMPLDMMAYAQAQVSGDAAGMQVALQKVNADRAIVAAGPYGAPPAPPVANNTPYIVAGVIGVVLIGGLIYAATK